MNFELACAVTQSPADLARLDRRRLERTLDGWIDAHRQEVEDRFALVAGEFDADASALNELARAVADAGRRVAGALAPLAASGLSVPIQGAALSSRDAARRFEEALDGALLPSAARVLGAALELELS